MICINKNLKTKYYKHKLKTYFTCLEKSRRSDNETWLIDKVSHKENFAENSWHQSQTSVSIWKIAQKYDDDDDDDDNDEDDDDGKLLFFDWLTDERRLILFFRDCHHCKSPTRRVQDLSLCSTRVQALLNEVVQKW